MKLVKPSYQIIEQEQGLEGIYKQIELAGRNCYKSENLVKYKYFLDGEEIPEDFELLTKEYFATAKEFYDSGIREIKCTPDDWNKVSILTRESTSKAFVERLIKSKHLSVLEHGTVYLKVPINVDVAGDFLDDVSIWTKCKLVKGSPNWWAITTNYRRIIELGYEEYLQYLCEPTEFHEKRVTVKLTTCIQAYKELTRHRKMSFAIESTRQMAA